MDHRYKRVNIMISEDQYQQLQSMSLNISGLVRDLLGDHLSDSTIVIRVSEETKRLYDLIVSNTGSTDEDIETHLKTALAKVLEHKIKEMEKIHADLVAEVGRSA